MQVHNENDHGILQSEIGKTVAIAKAVTKFKRIQTVAGSDGQQIFSKYAAKLRNARHSGQTVSAAAANRMNGHNQTDTQGIDAHCTPRNAGEADGRESSKGGTAPLRCRNVINLVGELDQDLKRLKKAYPSYEHAEKTATEQAAIPDAQAIALSRHVAQILAENFIRLNGAIKSKSDSLATSPQKRTVLEQEHRVNSYFQMQQPYKVQSVSVSRGEELMTEALDASRFRQYTLGSVYTMLRTSHEAAAKDEQRRNSELVPWLTEKATETGETDTTQTPSFVPQDGGASPSFNYTDPITNEVDYAKLTLAVDEDFLTLAHRQAAQATAKQNENLAADLGGSKVELTESSKEQPNTKRTSDRGIWSWVQRRFGGGGSHRLGDSVQVV